MGPGGVNTEVRAASAFRKLNVQKSQLGSRGWWLPAICLLTWGKGAGIGQPTSASYDLSNR